MKSKTSNLIILLILLLIFAGMLFPFLPINEWKTVINFHANRDEMEYIATSLFSEEQALFIENNNGYWAESKNEHFKKAYLFLKKENYTHINVYGNTVFFCKKTDYSGYIGIAFTHDGRLPQSNQGRIYSKKLDDNWYYCNID